MPKFHFSLAKLQKFQKQKQSLAEIDTLRRKADFDQAVDHFNELGKRLEQLVKESGHNQVGNVDMVRAHRDHIALLRMRVEQARQRTDEAAEAWRQSVDARNQENTRLESYDLLYRDESSAFQDRTQKAEQTELSDTIIRRWQRTEKESDHD